MLTAAVVAGAELTGVVLAGTVVGEFTLTGVAFVWRGGAAVAEETLAAVWDAVDDVLTAPVTAGVALGEGVLAGTALVFVWALGWVVFV